MSPYDQVDRDIQSLIRQGCTQKEAFQKLKASYSDKSKEGAEKLKRLQELERKLREQGQKRKK
ncbi:MAG: hypothetical protein AAF215_03520 [Cyanobacteria bacterium P01_A01_bin.123]